MDAHEFTTALLTPEAAPPEGLTECPKRPRLLRNGHRQDRLALLTQLGTL